MLKLDPSDLVDMTPFAARGVLEIDLAYAKPHNALFGQAIYRPDARLWLHRDLAQIVVHAAVYCASRHNARFILFDGLRTVEAQAVMLETERVRANPQWLQEPRLLSPPGAGGHPRAMAVDIGLMDADGGLLDMGTAFDFLAQNPHPDHNPAHRAFPRLSAQAAKNRAILDDCMSKAAILSGKDIFPLPQEWWDFRFPVALYESFEPLSDHDLPDAMKMMAPQ